MNKVICACELELTIARLLVVASVSSRDMLLAFDAAIEHGLTGFCLVSAKAFEMPPTAMPPPVSLVFRLPCIRLPSQLLL